MELKVVCQCGQKYKFDVEPVNGRMPFTVNCPVCNVDGTAAANVLLSEKRGTQPINLAAMSAPPPIAPAVGGLKINRHAPEPPAAGPATTAGTPRITVIQPKASAGKRQLEWYEHVWCALPLGLVAIGGAIGGGCGGAAWAVNRQVFGKMSNPALAYVVTGLISAAAFGAYLVLAVVFVMLFHK
jgi:hypothetical protein